MSLVTPATRRLVERIEFVTKSRMTQGKIPSNKEIGMKKVAAVLPRFEAQAQHARAAELLGDEWKKIIETMPPEELAARFLSMLVPEALAEPEKKVFSGHSEEPRRPARPYRDQRGGDRPFRPKRDFQDRGGFNKDRGGYQALDRDGGFQPREGGGGFQGPPRDREFQGPREGGFQARDERRSFQGRDERGPRPSGPRGPWKKGPRQSFDRS